MRREPGLHDLPAYWKIARYVRQQEPFDIFHAHSTKAGFLLRLVPRNGAKVVYTPHGLMTLNPKLRGFRRAAICLLESLLARVSNAVIAVSLTERRCAIATGIPAKSLIVIPNGLNPAHIPAIEQRDAVRANLKLASDAVCIATVGLLVPNKEHSRLLDAFALVASRSTKPVTLLVIGWGLLEMELRARAAALGISNSVRFLGQVRAIEYLPAVDILAHPSRYEGFAYVFLEALSAGIPVVTTRVGGADELVEPGLTGHICDPWNAEQFASDLLHFVENAQVRKSAAPAARARAAQSSSVAMVAATAGVYRSLRQTADASANKLSEGVVSRTPQ